ncbi:MAG: L,D-transpeptidase [Gammaproteobacteria bacterium]|nr:L,D-transpeptidase [Gammaproteobacteria bacterium]
MRPHIEVDLKQQQLTLLNDHETLRRYAVSTALNGAGEESGSGCTPRGAHRIRIRIGAGLPLNSVLIGRRPTGEIYSAALSLRYPERDWILTRILWLTGMEPGRNRGGSRDTLRRYIYIHGCPDTEPMGEPHSHGCIRMRNSDIVELFNLVEAGTEVTIA